MSDSELQVLKQDNEALRKDLEALRLDFNVLRSRFADLEASVTPRRKGEKHYQAILERLLSAKRMHIRGVGVTDLTTDDAHIEIKDFMVYHMVPGQLAKYNHVVPRARKCAYFFGKLPNKDRLRLIYELMEQSGIEMYIFDSDDVPYRYYPPTQAGNDILKEFIEEMVVADPAAALQATDAYAALTAWAMRKGRNLSSKKKEVMASLVVNFGELKPSSGNNNAKRVVHGWKGYKLNGLGTDDQRRGE